MVATTIPAYGVVSDRDGIARVAALVNGRVVFVGDVLADPVFQRATLDPFLALGPSAWRDVHAAVAEGVATVPSVAVAEAAPLLPIGVGDFVDFYASLHHATNLGRILRPDGEPLLPNWRHLPVAYHGRSATVAPSGSPVVRPSGLVRDAAGAVVRRPTAELDLELEVGFVVGVGNAPGAPIAVDDADRHVFGVVLVNDWSARDVQAFEYQPLGPFLGKSFLTSISPWVVPLDALRPFLVDPPAQDPQPDDALLGTRPWALDLRLEVELNGATIARVPFAPTYWTFAQMLAHLTSNGAVTRPGDLFASGTVSGPGRGSAGSLIEATWRGREPLVLPDGSARSFLHDGDTVTLRGWGGDGDGRVELGSVTGTVVPARS